MLATLTALAVPLAACQKAPEPALDQEEGNAIENAGAEIEAVPEDGLAAPADAINDMESQGAGDTTGHGD